MKTPIAVAAVVAAFMTLPAVSALADCQVVLSGRILSSAPQTEKTVLPADGDEFIEVRNDQLDMTVELHRKSASDPVDGILLDSVTLDMSGGYDGIDLVVEKYRVLCDKE